VTTEIDAPPATAELNPWPALWALVLGFFMILVDSTIVSVATNAILSGLHTDINGVVWVTSAYLLAYVVPLLFTGRLGDQLGPKRVYLAGMTVFTIASVWCGLAATIGSLIAARVLQGLGAALMTPQTMAVVTRIFPPAKRGAAMSVWGSAAGVALLVGPVAGGVLVDGLGWQWIFFVNVPVGLVGFVLAWRLVPSLPTHRHRFDLLGTALSAVGLFLLVFDIQEGQKYDWGQITGPISVWGLIVTGVLLLTGFGVWQARNPNEPLLQLSLFKDRNFSMANLAIAGMGFSVTGMAIPLMLYAQKVLGLSTIRAGLLLLPMALLAAGLARLAGQLTDRLHPRITASFGILVSMLGVLGLGLVAHNNGPVWQILVMIAVMGLGNPFVWAPLSATATRNLPLRQAGAGSGVYNTTRQVGAVLGSAAVGVLMQSRLEHHFAALAASGGTDGAAISRTSGALPTVAQLPFAQAMGESIFLAAAVLLLSLAATLSFRRPARSSH